MCQGVGGLPAAGRCRRGGCRAGEPRSDGVVGAASALSAGVASGEVVEDLLAEEFEAGAAVAAAFEELEAVDVPFGGAVAVRERQGGVHGVAVAVEVVDEAA